ncbi:MAG: endonuclease domain-containing protein, partial [Cryomorphaceae bacterium]
ALAKRMMLGFQFRRQRPISHYIVDFVCLPLKLVIEVDGYSHQLSENEVKDLKRQKALEDLGYKVLRFKDEDVLNRIQETRRIIQVTVEELSE